MQDHLHILTSLHPTLSLADLVKDIKTGPARWIKQGRVFKRFRHWQESYGAFTCSRRERDGLIEHIKRQEEHHHNVTFEEDHREPLLEAGIEFDERYLL